MTEKSHCLAVIGGSGLAQLQALEVDRQEIIMTPYGEPSAPLTHGWMDGKELIFLPRHGGGHTIPPHRVNYCANIWALQHVGVTHIIGVAAVGGISDQMVPEKICIPDQLIDYTWGRVQTFFDSDASPVTHIDFTEPYCTDLRKSLIRAAETSAVPHIPSGTYGITQGPRLETAAEIQRMKTDGCDLVGMTGMPEAALAHELGLCYASCTVIVNWAAGLTDGPITMEEINCHLESGMTNARNLLKALEI